MIRAAFVLLATPCWRSENTGAGRGSWGLPSSGPTWCCQSRRLVIAALGIIYGTLLGSLGLITGGLLGYGLMLTFARRFVQRFAAAQSLHKMESLFDRNGAWVIVLTRSLPSSVREAIVFLAGLAGMPMRKFTAALTIGSVPTAFVFAAIGTGWPDQPILALMVSYALPILLLSIALYLMRLRTQ
jgi:uncharacterized membrane protein YdjX (TVP38/TMEM64 family)